MDLAKIRKKSLQIQIQIESESAESVFSASTSPVEIPKCVPEAIHSVPASPAADLFHYIFHPSQVASRDVALPLMRCVSDESLLSPAEVLLAARTAAGCDIESEIFEYESNTIIAEEFLCFRVSDEVYGINIMDIKEIIKPRVVTEIPRAPIFVLGVLSLRGTIIPIIDMRIRLGLAHGAATGNERIVVIKNGNSFSGLMVDEVIQVVKVPLESVESVPAVLDGIDRDFVSGLGRSESRLIIILNLGHITDINLY